MNLLHATSITALLLAATASAQNPVEDLGIVDVTLPPDGDLVIVRERAYDGTSPVDLSAYGLGSGHTFIQSIYVRYHHGTNGRRSTVRGRLTFPPEVTVLGLITDGGDLGGSADDGVLTETDALFAVGGDPDAYSGPFRGYEGFSEQEHILLLTPNVVDFQLLERNVNVDDFRVIIDYGSSFPAGLGFEVEHLAQSVWSQIDLDIGSIVGDGLPGVPGSGDYGEVHGLTGIPLTSVAPPAPSDGLPIDLAQSILLMRSGGAMSVNSLDVYDIASDRRVTWALPAGSPDVTTGPNDLLYSTGGSGYVVTDLVSGRSQLFSLGIPSRYIADGPGPSEIVVASAGAGGTHLSRIDSDTVTVLGTHVVATADLGVTVGIEQAGGLAYLLGQSGELIEMDPITGAYTATVIPPGCAQYANIQVSANGQELYLLRRLCGTLNMVIDVYDIASGTTTFTVVTDTILRNPKGITLGAGGYVYVTNVGNGTAGKSMKAWDPATWTEVGYWPFVSFAITASIVGNVTRGLGASYCQEEQPVNSTNEKSWMAVQGNLVVNDNDFRLVAHALPTNQFGYFLASQTPGFLMNPGGSVGNICLANPIGRFNATPISNSGTIRRIMTDVDLTQIPGPMGTIAVMPGDTWYFQCWHRDNGNTNNFTDAIEVTFQ